MRQAVAARFDAADLHDLPRPLRALALQKTIGVLFAIVEEEGDLSFVVGQRAIVAGVFARFFDGVALDGPLWRLDPREDDRPTYEEWVSAADKLF